MQTSHDIVQQRIHRCAEWHHYVSQHVMFDLRAMGSRGANQNAALLPFNPDTDIGTVHGGPLQIILKIVDLNEVELNQVIEILDNHLGAETYKFRWNGLEASDRGSGQVWQLLSEVPQSPARQQQQQQPPPGGNHHTHQNSRPPRHPRGRRTPTTANGLQCYIVLIVILLVSVVTLLATNFQFLPMLATNLGYNTPAGETQPPIPPPRSHL